MTQHCPYCHGPVEKIPLDSANLRVCTECHATFISAKNFLTVRRELDEGSRASWMNILRQSATNFREPEQLLCLDHGIPLVQGNLPDYVIPARVPTCCDIQHLPPALWADLLERGLRNPLRNLNRKTQPTGWKGKILLWLQSRLDQDHLEIDPLDNIVFERKIRPLLEQRIRR